MGIGAYVWWGTVTALYVRALPDVSPVDVGAHRVVWASLNLLPFLFLLPSARKQISLLRSPRVVLLVLATTALIVTNWFTFIYAVSTNRLIDSSIGYFVTPLVSVVLARLFLAERMTPLQKVAIGFGFASVVVAIWARQSLPWISAVLALSFGFYGLLRKRGPFNALPGLAIEATIAMPFAVGYLVYRSTQGVPVFGQNAKTTVLLLLGGIMTIVPLLLFAGAAKRMRLTTLGMIQYLAPIGQLAFSVFVFHERTLTLVDYVTLGLIWIALGIYTFDGVRTRKRRQKPACTPDESVSVGAQPLRKIPTSYEKTG